MTREFNTSRHMNNAHKNFYNGYEHKVNSAKGLEDRFSVIENGEHQKNEGKLSSIKLVFDKPYLNVDNISQEEMIDILERAQILADKAKKKIRERKK